MNRFRHSTAWRFLTVTAAAVCLAISVPGQAPQRKLGTCGPPPRKNPLRQTSAEGMPPLPLPAVPLRRSEPKAEPAPPLMIAKLEYGVLQDWNTDPGDVDNLMRQVRDKLRLWYGWKYLDVNELAALHDAGKRCAIPILYISGHEAIDFTPKQRAAVRQYVLDGGTLLGDACCGRDEFANSFRKEVRLMFPDRAFEVLEADHPIFRAFYPYNKDKVHFIQWNGQLKQEFQGPPQLEGLNVGCRTAVILTPWDMSCGWDGHTHPWGKRLIPGDAVRLGINLISYVAAERQLGEVQAVTREIQAPVSRPRETFTLAQLRHQGDWNPDPNSVYQWLRFLALDSSLAVRFNLKYVDASERQLAAYPVVYMTGHGDPRLREREVQALRHHLQAGGFLFINNCCGRSAFDRHARELIGRLFPDQSLARIPSSDPIFKTRYTVVAGRDRQTHSVRPVELEGIRIKGRLVLVYSKNDTISQLKQVSDPFGNGYDADTCHRVAINVVSYAMEN